MLLQRRGLTGQHYDLVGDKGAAWGAVRLRPLRQAGEVTTVDGSTWRIERAARFGAWETREIGAGDATLVMTVKGRGRERYDLDHDGGRLALVRRRRVRPRRFDLLDPDEMAVGEVVRASMWSGAYDLQTPDLPPAVVATLAFVVVLVNRRDNAATWS